VGRAGCQRADGRSHGSLICYYYVEIDDGLGVQAWDSGAADVHGDVLNTSQRSVYLAAQSFELPRPLRVVRDDNGWSIHQAIVRDNGGPARIHRRCELGAAAMAARDQTLRKSGRSSCHPTSTTLPTMLEPLIGPQ